MRILWHAAGMFVFGTACLVAMGLAFEQRVSTPLPVERSVRDGGTIGTSGEPLTRQRDALATAAFDGVSRTLDAAARALERGHSGAALLDGSWRVAQVLDFAGASASTRQLLRCIETARHQLQNAQIDAAGRSAAQAATLASMAHVEWPAIGYAPLARYDKAVLLDPAGRQFGRVVGVSADTVTVEVGGLQALLGFIFVHQGRRLEFPRGAILFGEPRLVGETLVLAVTEPAPGA